MKKININDVFPGPPLEIYTSNLQPSVPMASKENSKFQLYAILAFLVVGGIALNKYLKKYEEV
jgi:hypothetical protein